MADRLVMGFWDCKYCNNSGIEGIKRECPHCGHPRDKDTKFYMKSHNHDEVVRNNHYLSEDQSKGKGNGPDWECRYCGSLNSVLDDHCRSCGHSRDNNDADYFQMNEREESKRELEKRKIEDDNDDDEYQIFRSSLSKEDEEIVKRQLESLHKDIVSNIQPELKFKRHNINWKPILVLGGILSIIFLLVWLLVPHEKTLHVLDKEWTYSIEIEKYKQVNEDDWSLPYGAELRYTRQEIHHYDNVLDHYETKTRTYTERVQVGSHTEYSYSDNGDGTFTEHSYQVPDYENVTRSETYQEPVYIDVPVYRTKYYYKVWRWVYERSIITQGVDSEPYYGDVILGNKEREGRRSEKYFLRGFLGNQDDNVKVYSISKDKWFQVESHSVIKVLVNRLNQITELR